jgi:asparagine synthase (glutamine-hydrolysing)
MCGFAGFVGKCDNKDNVLEKMMDTIIHRGPDSSGKYIDDKVALGFRRLSIIDLSEEANQPLCNEEQNKLLLFNGEIYNYLELREELIKAGHVFISNSDSETILHGYEEWGVSLLDRLRGMYAFVIWDKEENQLFGARDIFGVKPFYYAQMNETFFFGSEIKSFLVHPNFDKVFNQEALGNYLSFQFVPTNETFFKGVYGLQPGHYFTYKNGEMKTTRYFEPKFTGDNKKSFDEVVDDIEEVIKESVAVHKIADVEVASYLSSGVDSSYLAYLGQVDHTFTVGFGDGVYSEINEAKEFAKSINVKNDARVITPDEYWEKLSDILYYMDEPVADASAMALYFLSEEAAKKVKVVLSGEGSDELFGGYNIYCEPLEHRGFDKIPMSIRRVMGKVAEGILPPGTKGRGYLMRHGKTLEERYFANATNIFTEKEAHKILKNGCKPGIQKVTKPLYDRVAGADPVTKMQYLDLHLWMVHDILVKGDKMGMANSLEVRVPFLDKKVLDLALTLPLEYKVQPPRTKVALRAAADRAISHKTAQKKKLGFPIPIRTWLKEDKYYNIVREMFLSKEAKEFFNTDLLVKMLDDHKLGKSKNEKTDDSRRIWTVYVFLVWYERFFVQGCNDK